MSMAICVSYMRDYHTRPKVLKELEVESFTDNKVVWYDHHYGTQN
jgi:hypothetical protein